MQEAFQIRAGRGKSEDLPGEFLPVEAAAGEENTGAESLPNFHQSRLARLNDLAGEVVGVNHRHALLPEQAAGGGFAHGDPAGDAKKFHA